MGTPIFAVNALKAIHESKHTIVGVVTSSDKPAGRGKKIRQSAVKVILDNYSWQSANKILQELITTQ